MSQFPPRGFARLALAFALVAAFCAPDLALAQASPFMTGASSLQSKSLGRATGSSAVSAAAYRAGERIRDERTGRSYDHSDRKDVLHKEIMLPKQFAADEMSWAKDRSKLWNSAELAEVRSNARTAREYLVALPAELSPRARINLVVEFSRELVERYGFALDVTIHAPRSYPGSDPRNFHAHLLATTREVTPIGLGAKTTLEWSDTHRRQMGLPSAVGELLYVREHWATAANTALARERVNARIDHRTLKAQGIDREPKLHIPHVAFEMERQGYRSVVAERIRAQHQARVEARLQRRAQHAPRVAAPRSFARMAKEYALSWLGHRQAQEETQSKNPEPRAKESALRSPHYPQAQARPKSLDDTAMKAALRWKAQYGQAHHKSHEETAKEAAMRWRALYGPEGRLQEQAHGKVHAKEQAQVREQPELAPGSAQRTRGNDLDLSL